MGFLIFAYRKLALKRKINDLNYRAMVLSQRKQKITDQISSIQKAMAGAKSIFTLAGNLQMNDKMAAIKDSIFGKYFEDDGTTLKEGVTGIKPQETLAMMKEINAIQMGATFRNAAVNSIFESTEQAQLAALNAMDSSISMEIANIDSQTKQLMPELESVEKAESQAAKSEAPSFGLN